MEIQPLEEPHSKRTRPNSTLIITPTQALKPSADGPTASLDTLALAVQDHPAEGPPSKRTRSALQNTPSSMSQFSQTRPNDSSSHADLSTANHIPTQSNSQSTNHHHQTDDCLSPQAQTHTPHSLDTQTNRPRKKRQHLLHSDRDIISPAIHALS